MSNQYIFSLQGKGNKLKSENIQHISNFHMNFSHVKKKSSQNILCRKENLSHISNARLEVMSSVMR